jgi:hypothetical protein
MAVSDDLDAWDSILSDAAMATTKTATATTTATTTPNEYPFDANQCKALLESLVSNLRDRSSSDCKTISEKALEFYRKGWAKVPVAVQVLVRMFGQMQAGNGALEGFFSAAAFVDTKHRNSLNDETFQQVVFLYGFLRALSKDEIKIFVKRLVNLYFERKALKKSKKA